MQRNFIAKKIQNDWYDTLLNYLSLFVSCDYLTLSGPLPARVAVTT